MNVKESLIVFVTTFAVTLVVTPIVTFLSSLIAHGAGTIDWKTSFRFAIIFGITFGIVIPWTRARVSKEKEK